MKRRASRSSPCEWIVAQTRRGRLRGPFCGQPGYPDNRYGAPFCRRHEAMIRDRLATAHPDASPNEVFR